jgi:hypothetical protein
MKGFSPTPNPQAEGPPLGLSAAAYSVYSQLTSTIAGAVPRSSIRGRAMLWGQGPHLTCFKIGTNLETAMFPCRTLHKLFNDKHEQRIVVLIHCYLRNRMHSPIIKV